MGDETINCNIATGITRDMREWISE